MYVYDIYIYICMYFYTCVHIHIDIYVHRLCRCIVEFPTPNPKLGLRVGRV